MTAQMRGIPLEKDISGKLLPWLVAVMVYLVALALFSALALHRIAADWGSELSGQFTVQLPVEAAGTEVAVEAGARVAATVALLERTPGVAEVAALSDDQIARLLEPWLGGSADGLDLPLPRLIAVTLAPDADLETTALIKRLKNEVPEAILVDHQQDLAGLLELTSGLRLIAIGVILLVSGAAALMAVLVAKMGLAAHAGIIELLHLLGAEDQYILNQFQRHAASSGLIGGLAGLALSVATFAIIEELTSGIDPTFAPDLSLGVGQWALLMLLPLAAAAVTTLAVRVTVRRSLASLP